MRHTWFLAVVSALTGSSCYNQIDGIESDHAADMVNTEKISAEDAADLSCEYSIDGLDQDMLLPSTVSLVRIRGSHTAARTYTLPTSGALNHSITISKTNGFVGPNNVVLIKRADGVCLARFEDVLGLFGGRGWVRVQYLQQTGQWHAITFGGAIELDDDGC